MDEYNSAVKEKKRSETWEVFDHLSEELRKTAREDEGSKRSKRLSSAKMAAANRYRPRAPSPKDFDSDNTYSLVQDSMRDRKMTQVGELKSFVRFISKSHKSLLFFTYCCVS